MIGVLGVLDQLARFLEQPRFVHLLYAVGPLSGVELGLSSIVCREPDFGSDGMANARTDLVSSRSTASFMTARPPTRNPVMETIHGHKSTATVALPDSG